MVDKIRAADLYGGDLQYKSIARVYLYCTCEMKQQLRECDINMVHLLGR